MLRRERRSLPQPLEIRHGRAIGHVVSGARPDRLFSRRLQRPGTRARGGQARLVRHRRAAGAFPGRREGGRRPQGGVLRLSAAPFPSYPAIAVAAGAAALLALFRFLVRVRRDRLVADTPTARIRSAAQGYVKLTGRALPAGPAPTAAPLTSRPCVWWSYEIEQEQKDSRGNSRWRTIENGTSVELFALVDDDDARCLVGPVSAE